MLHSDEETTDSPFKKLRENSQGIDFDDFARMLETIKANQQSRKNPKGNYIRGSYSEGQHLYLISSHNPWDEF